MWSGAQTPLFTWRTMTLHKCFKLFERSDECLDKGTTIMLWIIAALLLLLWVIGFWGGFVTTNVIHLLLVGALVILALNLYSHRRPA
jgi:hypothetical protein